jgi:hypothetical protein
MVTEIKSVSLPDVLPTKQAIVWLPALQASAFGAR